MLWRTAKKSLHGHNHFVSDVVVSSDGMFALAPGTIPHTLGPSDVSSAPHLISNLISGE